MTELMHTFFKDNIQIINEADKAIFYFRSQRFDKAFFYVLRTIDDLFSLVERMIENPEYFTYVSPEAVLEMLSGIAEAEKREDYILLADLIELQVIDFVCKLQEFIISQESYPYDSGVFERNTAAVSDHDTDLHGSLKKPVDPRVLMEKGYSVEYSSCGLMTLAAEVHGNKYYMHSNLNVSREALILAESWMAPAILEYHVYGLGLGYHIIELAELAQEADIRVYESDFNIILLAFTFVDLSELLKSGRVSVIYDPDFNRLNRVLGLDEQERNGIRVYYPSYMSIMEDGPKQSLHPYLSGGELIADIQQEEGAAI